MKHIFYIPLIISLLYSCQSSESENAKKDVKEKVDSSFSLQPNHLAIKDITQLTDAKGFIGIFDVPEMLTISKLDSAKMADIPKKLAKGYSVLQEEMNSLNSEMDGAPGAIYYNNNPENFIFECIIPIKAFPKKQPKKTKIVVLEATKMLIYNFYGPYEGLYKGYESIKEICSKNKLEQSGPMREFYVTDPSAVKDSTQWLTRIMVPVK